MFKYLWVQKKYAHYLWTLLKPCVKLIYFKNYEIEIHLTYLSFARILNFLKNHTLSQYKQLIEIAVLDLMGKNYRFSVHYLFFSVRFQNRLRILVEIDEVTPLLSIHSIFPNASWLEREIWDLYGIFFIKHNDLRRILTDYGFLGHPLRKDFPLTGFEEIYYNDSQKKIIYEKVELAQEFRSYSINNPWIK